MLATPALDKALKQTPIVPSTSPLFRAVALHYLRGLSKRANPLFALGSTQVGARFTPKGGPPTLYFGESPDTALWEAIQSAPGAPVPGGPPRHIGATVLFSVSLRIDADLDLLDPNVTAALGTTPAELLQPWRGLTKPETHRLGLRVFHSQRYAAIRFASARHPGGFCWAVFVDRIGAPSFIELNDPQAKLRQRIP
jgi:RES domain-containing protein